MSSEPDAAAYFECDRCSIGWHAGAVNPAPPVCPSCGLPWDRAPLFPPAESQQGRD